LKAVSLFSGGLDSQLAVRVIQEQGISITGVCFSSPFFRPNSKTFASAEKLQIKLEVLEVDDEYYSSVIKNPVYGYGKHLNPCIDCHAYMFRKAGQFMEQIGASFLITGEVLGQRPMSQNKSALAAVDKLSGYKGLIVRPLSARLLPETIPETNGWIDRSRLLDISGRSRARQMELAQKYNITDYPSPAGGCLLTDENFSRRMKKLMSYTGLDAATDYSILRVGRHFMLNNHYLLVIGRKHAENEILAKIATDNDFLFKVMDFPGPLGLIRPLKGAELPPDCKFAAQIVARYSDAKNSPAAKVRITQKATATDTILEVAPLQPEMVPEPI
jgi:tRNA-specific 2-thiouridylase